MRRRAGFTLVELLVAMALIIFMMVILSEAFSVSLESFRRLKAVGDMNARMRSAAAIIRRDLAADHFEGKKRVSSTNLWSPGPPDAGFFRLWQGNPATLEGLDADGIPSYRATDHILHFTVKLRGNERQDFFSASVPAASPLLNLGQIDSRYQESVTPVFSSPWAEVAYFLRPNGSTAGNTPLYALYRRQLLVMPQDTNVRDINWGARQVGVVDMPDYREVSCTINPQDPAHLYFNTPADLTVPQRRFGMNRAQNGGLPTVQPNPADARTWTYPTLGEENPALEGNDLLMTDVISFEIQHAVANVFVETGLPASTTNNLFDAPGQKPLVFDTWTNLVDGAYDYSRWREPTTAPVPPPDPIHAPHFLRITAVKITLRVWDVKTEQTRQVTIIQDL